jgi:hypothetical protein
MLKPAAIFELETRPMTERDKVVLITREREMGSEESEPSTKSGNYIGVSRKERSIFWEVKVLVILSKELYTYRTVSVLVVFHGRVKKLVIIEMYYVLCL